MLPEGNDSFDNDVDRLVRFLNRFFNWNDDKWGIMALVGVVILMVIICVVFSLGYNFKPDTKIVVVQVTPTPNAAATELAIAQLKSTDMIAVLNAQMTMEAAGDEQERQIALAGMTQTAAAPVYTLEPATTPTPINTPTPTPTETPETFLGKSLDMACVDDDSGGGNFLEECIEALEEAFPEAEIWGYKGCDHELLIGKWSVVIMDYTMRNSLDGGACTRAILVTHSNTNVIGYSMDGTWEVEKFLDAGVVGFVKKPNTAALVVEIRRLFENGQ